MTPRIEQLPEKKLVGKCINMSYSDNKTAQLWRGFMPRRKEIVHPVGTDLYSLELYPSGYFDRFDPNATFEKWAAVEVSTLENIPDGMETLIAPAGQYAVFLHKGPASDGPKTYQYIFQTWLPNSDFTLDDRPHFAIMGEKYKHNSPDSEEEIWIPVHPK